MNKKLELLSLFLIATITAAAQNLPGKQEAGLWAPVNIKVDGNADEWDNKFRAYNKGVEIFYSMANDGDNLYIIIHAERSRVIEKMMEGGISFMVPSAQKGGKDLTVLFPVLTMASSWQALHAAGKTLTVSGVLPGPPSPGRDPYGIMRMRDSILKEKTTEDLNAANKILVQNTKEIKTMGITSVTDTITIKDPKATYYRGLPLHKHPFELIPINNEDGIRAASQFDEKGAYNCELAIPLKYLSGLMKDGSKFKYSIILNSRSEDERFGASLTYKYASGEAVLQDQDLEADTELSGEYTLAKKP